MRNVVEGLARGWSETVDLVLPAECAGCGLPGATVCGECGAGLAGPPLRCRPTAWPQAPPAWAGSVYEGAVQQLVVAWKDRGRHDVTRPLAGVLARAVVAALDDAAASDQEHLRDGLLLVPVPSSRAARVRRGDDVVRALALGAARRVRARPGAVAVRAGPARLRVVPALRLVRTVADQAGLARPDRARNLDGALEVRPSAVRVVAGRCCVVVDDVLTTGATAREAARALGAAGAAVTAVATASATPLRRGAGTFGGSLRVTR